VNQDFPEDCPQSLIDPWWINDPERPLVRGSLVWTYLPHPDQEPRVLVLTGRDDDPTDHRVAKYRIEPLQIKDPPRAPGMPVAALPTYGGEIFLVQRAKKRPALVLGTGAVPKRPLLSGPAWQTAPMMLVAPYYGVFRSSQRAGWNPVLVERIRRCAYPQYLWDKLPSSASTPESILRFDCVQPLAIQRGAFEVTRFRLSEDAVRLITEWYAWLISGEIPPGGVLEWIREGLFGHA